LFEWRALNGNPRLLGRAAAGLRGGWAVSNDPICRKQDESLSARTPPLPPHDAGPPLTAEEAAERFRQGELRRPVSVLVAHDGSWWRIKAAEFAS
jgi:hypothetical protein